MEGFLKNKGFSLIELMIVIAITMIIFGAVYVLMTGDEGSLVVTTYQNYESPFATHAVAIKGETTKMNTHRNLNGVPYWIESLRCNESAPTEQNQLQCLAKLRHKTEGNIVENIRVLCDQTRDECNSDWECIRHDSTGCVLQRGITQNEL